MAIIPRKPFKIFGNSGSSTLFGQFGSSAAGSPQTSKDTTVIQQLTAWLTGWTAAVVTGSKAAFLEDMNGFCYTLSYMIASIFQDGTPVWDSATSYYIGSIVRKTGTFELYGSLINDNVGNALPNRSDTAQWQYLDPWRPGDLKDTSSGIAQPGWLGCDGSAVSRVTYADLFAYIGISYGAGDGINTFNVPNFQRRVAVGSGGAGTGTLGNAAGDSGGEETHTLTTPEIPSHTHPTSFGGAIGAAMQTGGFGSPASTAVANVTGATGGGGAHNNIQPSLIVYKLIKT